MKTLVRARAGVKALMRTRGLAEQERVVAQMVQRKLE